MKKLTNIGISMLALAIILSGCTKTTDDKITNNIPENCTNWFDGCNNCFVKDGKIGGCTRMACEKNEEAKCTQFADENKTGEVQPEEVKIPENCTTWFDGCNNCTVKDGKAEACTLIYCEKNAEPKCTQFKE